jgi:general secretion pathway protein B
MSYILDALRRADAERERGEVPGLQSQQHALLPDEDAPARPRLLVWAVVALSLALVAAIAWNLLGRDTAPARAVGQVSPPPPLLPPAVPAAPTVLPSTVVAAPPPAASPAAVPVPAAAERRAARPAAPASATAAKRDTARSTPASSARPAAESRVYTVAELPEAIRREMPKLSVGGASYSNDAGSRMLIINGQIFHEGDRIAPGLELEKIRLRSALLSYKGYRYELTY